MSNNPFLKIALGGSQAVKENPFTKIEEQLITPLEELPMRFAEPEEPKHKLPEEKWSDFLQRKPELQLKPVEDDKYLSTLGILGQIIQKTPGIKSSAKVSNTILGVGKEITSPEGWQNFKDDLGYGSLSSVAAATRTAEIGAKKIGFDTISAGLARIRERDQGYLKTLQGVGIVVNDPRMFSDKIQDPKFILEGVAQNLPNIMISMGVGLASALTGGGAAIPYIAAFGTSGILEGGFAYNEAKDMGATDDQAEKVATYVGIINGLLEMIPIGRLVNKTKNAVGGKVPKMMITEIVKDVLIQMGEEGGTESIQEIVSNAFARTYDKNRKIFDGVAEAGFFGAILGALGGGVPAIISAKPRIGLTIEDIRKKKEAEVPAEPELREEKEILKEELGRIEGDIFMELDLAEAGKRIMIKEDPEKFGPTEYNFIAQKSTFPKWIPDHLKKAGIVKSIANHLIEGTRPFAEKSLENELYEAIIKQMADRSGRTIQEVKAILDIDPPKIRLTKAKIEKMITELLGRAKRPQKLSITGVKKAVAKIPTRPSPFVRKRKATLLKTRIEAIVKGTRIGKVVTKQQIKAVQTELLDIIDKSNLELADKAKFRKTIKNLQTQEQLVKKLPDIEKRITKLVEAETTRTLKRKIKKSLVNVKIKKQAGKPISRFTPEIQRVLTIIRNGSKLNTEGVQQKITANLEKYKDSIPPDEVALENYILSNWIMGLDTMSNEELQKLLNKINQLKETGIMATELQKFNRQADINQWRDKAISVLTGGKGLPPGIETTGVRPEGLKTIKEKAQRFISGLGKEIVGWKDILDMMSSKDKTSKPGESFLNTWADVLDEKNTEKRGMRIAIEKVKQIAKTALEVKTDRDMIRQFRDDSKEESLGVYKNAKGVNTELIFTKSEARKQWMELQDESLEETFKVGMAYTDEIIKAIENYLTPQDKAFVKAQLEFYQEYYDSINKVYRDIYGVDLPKNPNYSPLSREGIDRNVGEGFGEFMQEIFIRRQVSSGSLKSRVSNIRPLKNQSDIAVLEQHITEMEHFKAWAKKIRDMDAVFGDSKVRTAAKINHTSGMLNVLDGFMNDFTRGGMERAGRLKALDRLRGNFARAVLAVKISIGVKQLTSFIAYADTIPTKDFVAGTIDWAKNPIEKTRILLGSELMRERGKGLERDIKTAMKTDKWSNFRKSPNFLNSLMLNIQIGDKGAIVMGGWSVYKHNRNQGKTHEQALKAFESITESTQQSADLSELSQWQRGGTFAKLFTMFRSSPNQYVRKEIGAIRNLIAGRQGIVRTAKTIVIFHFLLPMFFQWVSDAFKWDPKEQLRAAIFGPLNGLFILGDMIEGAVRTALGMRVYPSEIPIYGIADDIYKAIRELTADDIDTEDIMDAISAILGFTGSIAGIPLKSPFDIGTGVKDIATGEFEQGFIKLLGWSPFVAEKGKKKTKAKSTKKNPFIGL